MVKEEQTNKQLVGVLIWIAKVSKQESKQARESDGTIIKQASKLASKQTELASN